MVLAILLGAIAVFVVVLGVMLAVPLRRAHVRAAEKAASERQLAQKMRLALSAPGASPRNPIVISTPVLVESKSKGTRCWRCDAEMRLEDHAAKMEQGRRLRVAKLKCPRCEAEREMYFELMLSS